MKLTSLRRLAAGASAAALVSASAFFGSSAAFAQPTPEETETATPSAVHSADTGQKSEDKKQTDEKKSDASAEKKAEQKAKAKKQDNTKSEKQAKKSDDSGNKVKQPESPDPTGSPSPTATTEPTTPPSPTPSQDPTEDPTDDPTAGKPKLSLGAGKISAEEFKSGGVMVTAENLQEGDTLVISGEHVTQNKGAADSVGKAQALATTDSSVEELEEAGTLKIKAVVGGSGTGSKYSETLELEIEKQDDNAFDPTVEVEPTTIPAEDLVNPEKGIMVTASNLQNGDIVTNSLTDGEETAEGERLELRLYSKGKASDFEPGQKIDFTVTVARGEESETFDFTVTVAGEDDAPAFDPKVSSAPDEITAADLANPDKGISITASNLQPGDVVTNSLTNEPETSEGEELVTGVYYEGDPSDFEVGDKVDFTVTVAREGEESKTFDFTVTIIGEDDGDDEKWEPELKVAPKKISVADFRNENKGVKLELTGCYPGEIATFIIEQYEGDLSYETEVETDEHGTAVIEHIHGTGNAPDSAYIGEYHVIASCIDGEEEAYGDFSVHAGDDSKGGGDSDKGRDRDRNELPRTGSDLTALYGAAGLLAVGAAAMAVGRRKSTKK